MKRTVVWFSCGVTSAVAAKIALEKLSRPVTIAYCDTGAEHPDNLRFLADCEKWFSAPVRILRSEKYESIWDVFSKTRYLVGPRGARCTTEMKKLVRNRFERITDLQVFGFDSSETARRDRFMANNPDVDGWFPLIEEGLSKADCMEIVKTAGIELPVMYKLGYRNNNCIGCVKGGAGYWNKIRRDFPEVFSRMAEQERALGVAINKRRGEDGKREKVFLDELPEDMGRYDEIEAASMSCGIVCNDGGGK